MKRRANLGKLAFLCSCAVLIFGYGVLVGFYEIFPFATLRAGAGAIHEIWRTRLGTRPTAFLAPARFDGSGVTRISEDRLAPGFTLLGGFFEDTNELRLIRPDGTIVQRWPVRFTRLFPDVEHIEPASERPASDWNTDINGALALPDGSVVFNFEYKGMVKLDRCGNVQWTVPRMTHHSIDLAGDGSFWVGGRRYVNRSPELLPLRGPYAEDTILKISKDGEILTEISVPELFFENDLQHLLLATGEFNVWSVSGEEIVHLNDIESLPVQLADRFTQFDVGDLLISLRNLNLILVVDPISEKVKWYQTGPWIRQHDPDFTSDGTISVFNNNTDGSGTGSIFGGSAILEAHPDSQKAVVLYGQDPGEEMYTWIRGKHQNLPNGNMLITESISGRVFEVTAEGDIVWEFINRFDEDEVARVNDAIRYPESYFFVTDWTCTQPTS